MRERSLPDIPYDFSLWISPLCHTLLKALDISRATVRVSNVRSSDLLIRSVITVRMSAVEREERKPYWKSDKREDFSKCEIRWSLIIDSKTLLTIGRRLIGRYLEGSHRSPEFLNTGHTDDLFQEFGKHDCRIHLLNSLDRMGDNSAVKFFRTTTGISSGPTALESSSRLMSLETADGVILRSDRSRAERCENSGRG